MIIECFLCCIVQRPLKRSLTKQPKRIILNETNKRWGKNEQSIVARENPISFDSLLWKHQPKNVYYGGPSSSSSSSVVYEMRWSQVMVSQLYTIK